MEREIVTVRIRLMIKYLNRLRGQFPLYLKQITDYLDSLEVKDA